MLVVNSVFTFEIVRTRAQTELDWCIRHQNQSEDEPQFHYQKHSFNHFSSCCFSCRNLKWNGLILGNGIGGHKLRRVYQKLFTDYVRIFTMLSCNKKLQLSLYVVLKNYVLLSKNALPLQNFLFLLKIFEARRNIFYPVSSKLKKNIPLWVDSQNREKDYQVYSCRYPWRHNGGFSSD